jgi:putative endonuclease
VRCFVPQHDKELRKANILIFVRVEENHKKLTKSIMNNTMIEYNEGYQTYYVYIITNRYRSSFYIGVTNNLSIRLLQHIENIETGNKTFASRYQIQFLVYFEKFTWIQLAIAREKELKGWKREKKLELIRSFNENFEFLNDRFV